MTRAVRLSKPGRRILAALAPGGEMDVPQLCLAVRGRPAKKTTPILSQLESVGWISGREPSHAEATRPQFGGPKPITRYYAITPAGYEAACFTNAHLSNGRRSLR